MLNPLVLSDRTTKHHSVSRVSSGTSQGRAPEANAFAGNEDALRVQAVEQVVKSPAYFADQVFTRDWQVVERHLATRDRVAPHFWYGGYRHVSGVEVDNEKRQPIDRPGG